VKNKLITSLTLSLFAFSLSADLSQVNLGPEDKYQDEQPNAPINIPDDEERDFLGGGTETGIYW
jgi:hypothetical protein